MSKLFSWNAPKDAAETLARLLEVQTKSYGALEIPKISQTILNSGKTDVSIADFGTGTGAYLNALRNSLIENGVRSRVVGFEKNKELCDFGKSMYECSEFKFENIDILEESPGENKFDVAVIRFTLQHCSNISKFIENVRASLKKNGQIFILEPIYSFYGSTSGESIFNLHKEKMIQAYRAFGGSIDVGLSLPLFLLPVHFESKTYEIMTHSRFTHEPGVFEDVTSETARALSFFYPEIFDTQFCEELPNRLELETTLNSNIHSFASIGYLYGEKK